MDVIRTEFRLPNNVRGKLEQLAKKQSLPMVAVIINLVEREYNEVFNSLFPRVDIPTQEGYYWIDGGIVFLHKNNDPSSLFFGRCYFVSINGFDIYANNGDWYGPIPEPLKQKKANEND